MSNRFTKYTADKLRADGWLDKEQAATLRTRLQQVESERDKAEADAVVMRGAVDKAKLALAELSVLGGGRSEGNLIAYRALSQIKESVP